MTRPTHEEFRTVGFSGEAATYPRDELALRMFAAFNGVTVEQLPEPFKFFPNESTQRAWNRVAAAAIDHCSPSSVSDYVKAVEQERDDAKADYLRRHNDAVDRFEQLTIAEARIRTLEEENSNLRKAIQRLVDVYGDMQDGNGEPCPDIAAARPLVQSKSTEESK